MLYTWFLLFVTCHNNLMHILWLYISFVVGAVAVTVTPSTDRESHVRLQTVRSCFRWMLAMGC
jgi:hypothetical protein